MKQTRTRNCVMCDDVTEFAEVKLPCDYTDTMKNADETECPSPVVGAPLCENCKDISVQMVTEYETSPLPEWDFSNCIRRPFDNPVDVIRDSAMLIQAEDEPHVMDCKIEDAKIVAFAAARRGDIKAIPR